MIIKEILDFYSLLLLLIFQLQRLALKLQKEILVAKIQIKVCTFAT